MSFLGNVRRKMRAEGVWLDKEQAEITASLFSLVRSIAHLTPEEKDFIKKFDERMKEMR
jgi:hypothetical protein